MKKTNPLSDLTVVDMSGVWTGIYTYNIPDKYKDERTQKVEFTIMITSARNKNFEGTVEDNLATGGTPGVGKIIGVFTEGQIIFEKNMPIYTRIEKDGSHSIDKNKKHPTILYTGEFSRDKKTISGTWKFKKKVLVWLGIIPLWITPGNGSFTMSKINS